MGCRFAPSRMNLSCSLTVIYSGDVITTYSRSTMATHWVTSQISMLGNLVPTKRRRAATSASLSVRSVDSVREIGVVSTVKLVVSTHDRQTAFDVYDPRDRDWGCHRSAR